MKKLLSIFIFLACVFNTQQSCIAQNSKIDSLQILLKKKIADTTKVSILTALSDEFISYDIKTAENYSGQALDLAKKKHTKAGEAYCYIVLSKIERSKGNQLESLNKIIIAIKIFEQLHHKKGLAEAYFELGYLYKDTDNYKKSIESFTKSLTLYNEIHDELNAALCQMVMGHVNADHAWVVKDTAYLRNTLNLYGKALDYYTKIDNKERICVSLLNLANSYLGYDRLIPSEAFLKKSLEYSNQSLKISISMKDNTRTAINLLNIGEAYRALKKYPEAVNYLSKAYALTEKSVGTDIKMAAIRQLILTYKETGSFDKIFKLSDQAVPIAQKNHYIGYLKEHYKIMSEIYSALNSPKKAYENRLLYEVYTDSILNEEKANALIKYQIEFESEAKDKEIALLNKNQELQDTKIEQQQTIRNALAAAVALTLLLLLLLYSRFKNNIKTSRIIKEKNKKLEKLSIVARETANGVFITDKNGNAEWFNEGFSKLFGWENLEEYLEKRGRNISEVSGKNDIKEVIKKCVSEKKSIIYDAINPTKYGTEIWVQTTLTPIFNKSGELKNLVFVDADITELKNSEERYSKVNKELEAFSYSVSHDLRAPLRAINGYSQILKSDYGLLFDEDGKNILEAILNNSRKMGELIDDLLTFSRLGRTELNTTMLNMEDLVKAVLEEQIRPEDPSVEVTINEILPAKGSPSLLTQVWVNLISNALKFSKDKEKIRIEIGSYQEEDIIIYYIKDNGAGFDMQYYHKLFGVFQRLHSQEEFEGTGIGLAIIQRIIQRHNGTVWAESRLTQGSCFYFSLPAVSGIV
ncbi:ATP-binding protein [Flavobacterium pedocola]